MRGQDWLDPHYLTTWQTYFKGHWAIWFSSNLWPDRLMAVCNGTVFIQECELLTPAEATRALFSKPPSLFTTLPRTKINTKTARTLEYLPLCVEYLIRWPPLAWLWGTTLWPMSLPVRRRASEIDQSSLRIWGSGCVRNGGIKPNTCGFILSFSNDHKKTGPDSLPRDAWGKLHLRVT